MPIVNAAVMFQSPRSLIVAIALAIVAVLVAALRRLHMPKGTCLCVGLALLSLVLAAGGMVWQIRQTGQVVVMVDLSSSTRGADYRDPQKLQARLRLLLENVKHRVEYFGHETADRTVLSPPQDADALVLFTDARFELPKAAPPSYVVTDPALEDVQDARVLTLELRGNDLAAKVFNGGGKRKVGWIGTNENTQHEIGTGTELITIEVGKEPRRVSVQLSKADRWDENDALTIFAQQPMHAQRWWVGAPPAGLWTVRAPNELPVEGAEYLAAGVIVLDNVAAGELSATQQQRLLQYVRDLGGALVILGGENAFAAGDYPDSALEELSPLASDPPAPTTHWMLLADRSGSMAQKADAKTKWEMATAALTKALWRVPRNDLVSLGNFARDLKWSSRGKSATETLSSPLPAEGIGPGGPTNLQAAIKQILAESDPTMRSELLVLTDAQTQIDNALSLITALKEKKIRLHVLAIGTGAAMATLKEIVTATGGVFLEEADAGKWGQAVGNLLRTAAGDRLFRQPIDVHYLNEASKLGTIKVDRWNRTWLKPGATELARANNAGQTIVLGARWMLGSGQVVALAFGASLHEVESLAEMVAGKPRDPRFIVTWDMGRKLSVQVDAIEQGTYLNGLKLRLELKEQAPAKVLVVEIPQTAPGRYQLSIDPPRAAGFASICSQTQLVDQVALAARYAPEFDALGNDRQAMTELAQRTGGRVIEPQSTSRLDFHWPRRNFDLTSWLAAGGALLLAAAVVRWRLG